MTVDPTLEKKKRIQIQFVSDVELYSPSHQLDARSSSLNLTELFPFHFYSSLIRKICKSFPKSDRGLRKSAKLRGFSCGVRSTAGRTHHIRRQKPHKLKIPLNSDGRLAPVLSELY